MSGTQLSHILHYYIGTCLGLGRSPIAPGTVGSAFAALMVWFFFGGWVVPLLVTLAVIVIGIISSTWLVEAQGEEDPSMIVVDEVAGQFVTFLFIPHLSIWWVITGFVLFRIFDIWKPWPVDKAEELPSGTGVMLDDVMAGIYANIILHLLIWIFA